MSKTAKKNGKEINSDEKYQKLELHEHILKKSGMYVGSTKKETACMWIFNEDRKPGDPYFINKEITYTPGFYKIFDEILVNARDHVIRCRQEKAKDLCTMIKVWIDKKSGRITVWNNGAGISTNMHSKYKMLIPSMIFGELLTGSNFDDSKKRIWGGTNGVGGKLANIFSMEFVVETLDAVNDKKFRQIFRNNMYDKGEPVITPGKGKKPYTQVSFIPDFAKFGLKGLTPDIIALFKKRVYDVAMNSGVKVYYNDELIEANSFTKYVDLYFPEESEHQKVVHDKDANWKVAVVYNQSDKAEHQTISFVNGICTSNGGCHADYIVNQITNKLKDVVSKKAKDVTIKPAMIKENLIFFIDSCIVNPEFNSQTKEYLTTKPANFGSTYTPPDHFLKAIIKTGVVDQIVANALAKAEANIKTARSGPVRFEKLYDAHHAHLKHGDCTLIVTEGDSAKTFAMSGLNVIGREKYGVFPLKGKLLNVRDESKEKIKKNEEIQAIMAIVGLDPNKQYNSTEGLRYGHIMVLADQDHDGHHIKGLIMNFIHYFWPSLIKNNDLEFVTSFNTPIIKAVKGKGKNQQVAKFSNEVQFEEWKKTHNDGRGWTIKYYKGLGTSNSAEAQECFEDMEDKLIRYYWQEKEASKSKSTEKKNEDLLTEESDTLTTYKSKFSDASEYAMKLAFARGKVDKKSNVKWEDIRKSWLNTYDPKNHIDGEQRKISYYDFINKELIAFAVYNTSRAVPNIMDGFKSGQRKVYFGCLEKNIYNSEIKVAQLSGSVSERAEYHHGEASLQETIIKMAQNYVGSGNNINLLLPNGQFGSRLCGGKDAASPRYIHTQLNMLCKKLFREEDQEILEHQYGEVIVNGKPNRIEPVYYAPILPLIMINGVIGIGTGYSCTIHPCDPRAVNVNLRLVIMGEKPKEMIPWYRNFTGTIEKIDKNKFLSRGKWLKIDDDTIHIVDLPIGEWTDEYKAFLDGLLEAGLAQKKANKKAARNKKGTGKTKSQTKGRGGSKKRNYLANKAKNSRTAKVAKDNNIGIDIKGYKDDCTDIRVSFTIYFYPGKLAKYIKNGTLEKNLKLVKPLNNTNMHLFDANGKIKKYSSYGSILKDYAAIRLELYQKRKDYLLGKWKNEMDILKWKLKFVEEVRAEKIEVFKKNTNQINEQLEKLGFPQFASGEKKTPSYEYLTNMSIIKFTKDEAEKLRKQIQDKKEEIETLEGKTPSQIWLEELDEFMEAYDKWEAEQTEEYQNLMHKKKGTTKRRKSSKKQEEVNV